MKNGKFTALYETIYNRFKQGAGFLEGDVVKFKDGYKSEEAYKELADSIKARLEDCEKAGFNLRIGRLHTANSQYGSLGLVTLPATHADLYQELSPGNFGNLITVPVSILDYVDTGVNLAPVSPKNKRSAKEAPYQKPTEDMKPIKDAATDEQTAVGHEQTHAKKGNYELGKKDKKSSVGANSYDDNKPSKFKPLPKNKKVLKEHIEALENIYGSILLESDEVAAEPEGLAEAANRKDISVLVYDDGKLIYNKTWSIDYTENGIYEWMSTNKDMINLLGDGVEEEWNVKMYKSNAGVWCYKFSKDDSGLMIRFLDRSTKIKQEATERVEYDESMVRPECWDREHNTIIDECKNPDGSIKEECWSVDGVIGTGGDLRGPQKEVDEVKAPFDVYDYISKNYGDTVVQEFEADHGINGHDLLVSCTTPEEVDGLLGQYKEVDEDLNPGQAAGGVPQAPEENEQTSALEEQERVKAYKAQLEA